MHLQYIVLTLTEDDICDACYEKIHFCVIKCFSHCEFLATFLKLYEISSGDLILVCLHLFVADDQRAGEAIFLGC